MGNLDWKEMVRIFIMVLYMDESHPLFVCWLIYLLFIHFVYVLILTWLILLWYDESIMIFQFTYLIIYSGEFKWSFCHVGNSRNNNSRNNCWTSCYTNCWYAIITEQQIYHVIFVLAHDEVRPMRHVTDAIK